MFTFVVNDKRAKFYFALFNNEFISIIAAIYLYLSHIEQCSNAIFSFYLPMQDVFLSI